MRSLSLGRKNWMFAGSDAGGQRAACIYTMVETAKMHGLNPQSYLADIVGRIADHPSRQTRRPAALELDTLAQLRPAPDNQNRGLQPLPITHIVGWRVPCRA